MKDLRIVELSGKRRKMGRAFGEEFREDIHRFTEIRIGLLARFVKTQDAHRDVSRDHAVAMARKTLEAHREYEPNIWEEFCGIAEGAGLKEEELIVCNGLTDLRDYVLFENRARDERSEFDDGECSTFLVPADVTGAAPIVGQTWDMHADAIDYIVVVRRKPDDAPETLALTTVGCLCLIGMNSEGVTVGNNNLVATDARVGVNYLFTITKALQCRTANDAAGSIESTLRLGAHNYYMADAKEVINMECTATRLHRDRIEGKAFTHTNHFLVESLKEYELPGQNSGGSIFRNTQLSANFAALQGPVTMEDGWAQLSDDTREQGAICNEDYEGKYSGFATVATVVQCPGEHQFWICAGGAKSGKRLELTV